MLQTELHAFYPCKKPAGHLHGVKACVCEGAREPFEAWMGRVDLPPQEPLLHFGELESEVVFDPDMTFFGECLLDLGPSFGGWNRYVGPCKLSSKHELIPSPDSEICAEVCVDLPGGGKFRYKGPCVYEEGKGMVPLGLMF